MRWCTPLGAAAVIAACGDPAGPATARDYRNAPAGVQAVKAVATDFSGQWIPGIFYQGRLDDPGVIGGSGGYTCFTGSVPEISFKLTLTQTGTRVAGTAPAQAHVRCEWTLNRGWSISVDDQFDGRVHGDEIRFSLNQHLDIRATMSEDRMSMHGTIRFRIDPSPYAKPFYVEQPITVYRYGPPPA